MAGTISRRSSNGSIGASSSRFLRRVGDGYISQLLAWFETGQGVPRFHTDEVIETSGERLVLCRIGVSFQSGQTSEFLQIYRYDEAVERLELVIAYDVDDVEAAKREFAEVAAEP